MDNYKMTQTLSEADLQYLNKKYNRFSMGPSGLLHRVSYLVLIYTIFTLYMVFLQIQLFSTGVFAYLGLFSFRLISGIVAFFLFFGKFNPLILKLQIRISPKTCLSKRTFTFLKLRFETEALGKKEIFAYGEIIKCDFSEEHISFQTKNKNFIIRKQDMVEGQFSDFFTFMKGQKNNFNQDPRLARKKMLEDL